MKRTATIVVDLGFGDAGKGTVVDYLARSSELATVVRFNGGAQAAHNVVTADGRHHKFAQFGSGMFVPNVRSHLSRFALIDPETIRDEASALTDLGCHDPLARFSVHEDSVVVTPFHKSMNILREFARGKDRHGTCGMGIGECMQHRLAHPGEVIHAKDLTDARRLRAKLRLQHERFLEEIKPLLELSDSSVRQRYFTGLDDSGFPDYWAKEMVAVASCMIVCDDSYLHRLAHEGDLILEGAQGVLLDEWYGFHPHTTWSTTTFDNALALLQGIDYDDVTVKLGVLRAYHVRHGEGPFPTEEADLSRLIPEYHNSDHGLQGGFRAGWFDAVLSRYALSVCNGVDALAITHLDRLKAVPQWKIANGYIFGDQVICDIPTKAPSHRTDLVYQERLTGLLADVDPLYHEDRHLSDPDMYIHTIEDYLGSPVVLESHGPTALDKRRRVSKQAAA